MSVFAWTLPEMPALIKRRNAAIGRARAPVVAQVLRLAHLLPFAEQLAAAVDARRQMQAQPVFCLELAMRLLYWARLAYQYQASAAQGGWASGWGAPGLQGAGAGRPAGRLLFQRRLDSSVRLPAVTCTLVGRTPGW
jgi:hypothetical protein